MMIMMIQDRDDSDVEDDYDDDHDDDLMFSKGHHLTLKCCQKHNLQVCSNQQYFDIVYSSEKFGTTCRVNLCTMSWLRMDWKMQVSFLHYYQIKFKLQCSKNVKNSANNA